MTKRGTTVAYRRHIIVYDPPPIPKRMDCDWQWEVDGWDLDDTRYGHGPSLEACKAQIDEYLEDDE